jgi:hypothetical protein
LIHLDERPNAQPDARANGPESPWFILDVREMKVLLAISFGLLICGCSADVQRQATLVLPDKIARGQNDAQIHPATEITWDEDEAVAVDVEFNLGAVAARDVITVVGNWSIYDVNDKAVAPIDAVIGNGMDPLRGKVLLRKGRIRLPFEPAKGNFLFNLKAGRYYAIASFSGSFRARQVRFTTEKRWFEITDEH